MKFTFASLSAFLAAVSANVAFTNSNFDVTVGQPFKLTWSGATGAVTIYLANGPSTALTKVDTIVSGVTDTSFTWTPPTTLSGTYAFEITDSDGTNYSTQFVLAGTGSSSTSGTATSTSSASSSASKSSSTSGSTSSASSSSSGKASSSSSTSVTSSNSTVTSTRSSSSTSTHSSSSTSSTARATSSVTPVSVNGGFKESYSVALIVSAFAAVLYFN